MYIYISKGQQQRLLIKMYLRFVFLYTQVVGHIFGILLKFTCQIGMIQIRKVLLW